MIFTETVKSVQEEEEGKQEAQAMSDVKGRAIKVCASCAQPFPQPGTKNMSYESVVKATVKFGWFMAETQFWESGVRGGATVTDGGGCSVEVAMTLVTPCDHQKML